MNPDKEQISARQLMFVIIAYIQGSALTLTFLTDITKQDSWIAVIAGYLLSLLVIGIYILLADLYPGKSLVQINSLVFGKIPGKILSLLYIYFFFSLCFLNTRNFCDFINGFILTKTPMIVIAASLVFICAWAVRKGVETLTRYGALFVVITFIVTIAVFLLLLKDMKISNFLPVFTLPVKKYIQGTHTLSFISFGEIVSFMMFIPCVKDTKKIGSAMFWGVTIGMITILTVIVRNTAVLGPIFSMLSSPTFEAIRYIDIDHTLTRMEVLYAGLLISLTFIRVSIVFFAAVAGIEQVFELKSYKSLVPVVGVMIVIFSVTVFDSAAQHAYWGMSIAAAYSTLFELILPLLTLLAALFRKPSEKKKLPENAEDCYYN